MRTNDLLSTPIKRVWYLTNTGYKVWESGQPRFSDLHELIPGENYSIFADAAYKLGNQNLQAGWNYIEFGAISFAPGTILTLNWWGYAKDKLKAVGLWRLLPQLGVKEVKIVAELPAPATGLGQATVWPSTGTILVLDTLMWPPSLFPAIMVHEAIHIWQSNTGLFDGSNKNELMAYMGSQIYHWLDDGEEVFKSPSYPVAQYLGGLQWN